MSNGFMMSGEEFHKWINSLMFPEIPYRSIKKDFKNRKNVNSMVCSQCGGKCCKRCGCHFSPDDFNEISFEFLKGELEKGYISIDYVEGEMILQTLGIYILRIRNQGAPIVDFGYQRRTPCILLTEKGCKLDYAHRPTGGKLLIPDTKFESHESLHCQSKYSVEDCCYEWKPHQRILRQLADYFSDKNFPCSIR